LKEGVFLTDLIVDWQALRANFDRVIRNEDSTSNEYVMRKKNGREIITLVRSLPILSEGVTIGVRSVIIDLTEQREFQKEKEMQKRVLVQSEKMLALGQLSAGMAHEINQPLSVISLGLSNTLHWLHEEHLDVERAREKLVKMQENVARIKSLIEHIRVFSRDQGKAIEERINAHEAIDSALSLIATQYQNHEISIERRYESEHPYLNGNIYKFEQVMLNLLSNAKDAIDAKQEQTGSSYKKEISITSYNRNGHLIIDVRDNGTGIHKDDIDKVLNPFYTTKSVDKGTGLGLSVSYGIVKDMGGDIEIESMLGEYATIRLTFPIDEDAHV
jgi:C4-dicarboxylate-specific signal transduction histidine kinase